MNRDQLQQKFGIAERVRFAEGRDGLTLVELQHTSGASCALYLHGAHVTSWQPAPGREVLFVSRASRFEAGAPIRGGIPVVFPQFGDGPLPKHGLARNCVWTVARTFLAEDGAVAVSLELQDNAQTRAFWPHPFGLQLTVSLGSALNLEFTVRNPGPAPFAFQAALHTYFNVADIARTSLLNLEGTVFNDFLCPGETIEKRGVVVVDRETDRIYVNAPDRIMLQDGGNKRALAIAKSNMPDIVLWNPWSEKSRRMADFGGEEYRRMVCIETGRIRAPLTLEPGAEWSGRTAFVYENAE